MKKVFLSVALASTMTLSAANPFMSKYKTPRETAPFDKIKIEHYLPAFEQGIKEEAAAIDAIVNNTATPTFANTIEVMSKSGSLLDKVAHVYYGLMGAESNDEIMALAQTIQPMLSEHGNNIKLNPLLFEKIKYVYDNQEQFNLNPEQKMLLKKTYDGFAKSGANLNDEQKEVYRELSKKLGMLTLQFGQNALKATNAYEMLLTNEDDLAGLPQYVRDAAALEAKNKGKEGYLFSLKATGYIPFMKYSSRRDLREQLYRAYNSRCIEGEFSNADIMRDIATTRLEIAKLLGYEDYASSALENRMAENETGVRNLLNQLLEAYRPTAIQEVRELQGFAIATEDKNVEIMPWDWSYYRNKLKDAKFEISDEILNPCFPLDKVKEGVFGLATKLYGITFKKNSKIPVYHPEVDAYEVFDKDGKYLSVLYTDFHPRDGKRAGAWMSEYKGQWKEGKKDSRPHVTIVMNFTRPTEDKPALLTYDEAETFLHEFGHALHGMLSNCTYESLSGTSVYRDFVELPSQVLENYLGEKEFLDTFAAHYETGEKIPAELVEKINAASTFNAGYACLRQLSFGLTDMAYHTIKAPIEGSLIEFEKEALGKSAILPSVDNCLMGATFSHIFSGGYAAGYYSYKWAEVLDADAYAVFKANGIFNEDTASKFRKSILEKGGSAHPMELYIEFKGSEPTIVEC